MADKSPQAFRTIREVADWLEVEAHALRFWESKFSQIKPVKRAGGRRYYRPADMRLIGGIKTLLHDQGLTIRGVQKLIREDGVAHVAALSPPLDEDLDTVGDQIIEAVTEDESQPAPGGFIDIEALAGNDSPVPEEAPAGVQEPEPEPEPDAQPPHAGITETAPAPEPADTTDAPDPDEPAPELVASTTTANDIPATAVQAGQEFDTQPTPLSELRALLHGAVPFTLDQRHQLAPMVARLEALTARLDGRGPTA